MFLCLGEVVEISFLLNWGVVGFIYGGRVVEFVGVFWGDLEVGKGEWSRFYWRSYIGKFWLLDVIVG